MMTFSHRHAIAYVFLLAFDFPLASAGQIDDLLAAKHTTERVQPTEICDDETFCRRVTLDLIGRVPTTDELDAFLASCNRLRKIDALLRSSEHARYWSHLWTTMLIGRDQQRGVESELLRSWIETKVQADAAWNQVCFELISATGVTSLDGPVNYVVANRADPVMRLARSFLSVQLDCAECHDHPHDRWTNDDYLAMKRFYRPLQVREVAGGYAVSDSATEGERPIFLTGRKPHTRAWRRELAVMVVSSKPFSRSIVNRTWSWLMGRGMIDPVDGLSRDNPAATPKLLEALAAEFQSDFKIRSLVRKICHSKAYQRAPLANASSDFAPPLRLFAARNTRLLTPEQWITSVDQVLDRIALTPAELTQRSRQLLGRSQQASLGFDPYVWNSTTQTLIRQLSGDIPTPIRDLETIFRATIGRNPNETELRAARNHVSRELLFALVHCNEFLTND